MSKITYRVYENTCNNVNTLALEATHPFHSQLIAAREHYLNTGNVICRIGESFSRKDVSVEDFAKEVSLAVEQFELKIEEVQKKNIASNLVGREVFSIYATK